MCKKHKKICKNLTYIENLLILPSAVTWFVLISPFNSSVGIPVSITRYAVGIKICAITGGINKYKSIT